MRRPSTLISSTDRSAFVPSSVTVLPFTDTRPCVISSSDSRRDATPAAERTFWRRSPPSDLGPRTSDLGLFIKHARPEVYQLPDRRERGCAIDLGVGDERRQQHA